jgi:hypothetical protein
MPQGSNNPHPSSISNWLRAGNLDPLTSVARVIIIFDIVFRGIAAVQLFGYASTIGFFYTALKLIAYAGGIVGSIALLQRQKWGASIGIAAAAIGFWLVAIDGWSLFHAAFGPSLIAPGNFLVIRSFIKTTARGAWLAIYVVALVVMLQHFERRSASSKIY